MRHRLLRAASAAALLLALTAPASWAVAPAHGSEVIAWDTQTSDICSFPVDIHVTLDHSWTQFFDQGGTQVRWIDQDVETDVFSANGKTLTGLPFRYVAVFTGNPDDGFTSFYANGGVERVPLPDGSIFWSAGRVDWLQTSASFTLTPTVGHSGNVEAFCAALSAG